jgi:hypothetical protein
MSTSRFETRKVHIPIDAKQALPLLRQYYKEDAIDLIELKIKKTFRSKEEILKVIEETLYFDLEYGLLVLANIFPDLFNNKRFLNRLKKHLV